MQIKFPALTVLATLGFAAAIPAMAQQGASAYSGVSQPPTDAILASPDAPQPKPSAAVVATPAPDPAAAQPAAQPAPDQPAPAYAPANQTVQTDQNGQPQQVLYTRPPMDDPDGDIVQPRAARPGELIEGATIRVKLLDRLSSSDSERGEPFHGQVASDVYQDGKVLIPAGSGIEGRVTEASSGHFGGHGSLHLKPEAVIMPDGTRFQLHAETTGTPGSNTRIGGEGAINPGSRAKRDGIEYGSVVGAGVVTGAIVAGPVGALTGGLIGAGVVTTHLMVDHPQATLEPGSVILFTLTESMNLAPMQN
jgi:hypothetical protein